MGSQRVGHNWVTFTFTMKNIMEVPFKNIANIGACTCNPTTRRIYLEKSLI